MLKRLVFIRLIRKKPRWFSGAFFLKMKWLALLNNNLLDPVEVLTFEFHQVDTALERGQTDLVAQDGEGLPEYLAAVDVGE